MDEHGAARADEGAELVVRIYAARHRHGQPARDVNIVLCERARHVVCVRIRRHIVRVEGVAFERHAADPGVNTAVPANRHFTEDRVVDVVFCGVAEFMSMLLSRR